MELQDLANLGTALASIANLALVGFAVAQLRAFRRQIIHGQEAVEAARAEVLEAARTRTDEQAPRVIALTEAPQWPPFVDQTRTGMPTADESRLLSEWSLNNAVTADTEEFIFPEQRDWFMWFRTRGVLINEGRGTARVRLDGEAEFISGVSPLAGQQEVAIPASVGTPDRKEYLLRPGATALFEWGTGHPLGEWADKHDEPTSAEGELIVQVFDSTEYGVQDTIRIVLGARPIEPVERRSGHWRLSSEPRTGITVWPTRRHYRAEVARDEAGMSHPRRARRRRRRDEPANHMRS